MISMCNRSLMSRAVKQGVVLFLLVCLGACAAHEKRYYITPSLIQGTQPKMTTPGFWTGLIEEPDEVIIPAYAIESFNASVRRETGKIKDISQYAATYNGGLLKNTFSSTLESWAGRRSFDIQGERVQAGFFDKISSNMNLAGIPEKVNVCFGIVTAYSNQRILPTDSGMYAGKVNHAFDRLQNSALDIGTPLAILHWTSDKKWLYADSPLCSGWLPAQNVGLCSREQLIHYTGAEPFVVTLPAKTDLFLDEDLRRHHAYVRMGTRFVSKPDNGKGVVEILLPLRSPDGSCLFMGGFVAETALHHGYLPYTPRTIITQAFAMLNAPYGWGGMYGEQDCSRFIQEIFATVGIHLPRNSTQQAKVGMMAALFEENMPAPQRSAALFEHALAGISILQMRGHVMLYLGFFEGEPYAIHDMWGYLEPDSDGERLRVTNRVVVTDLSPGSGTSSGSLLERLRVVRVVDADKLNQ
ncbi:MAG: SH3 domain-containing protein [Deltaproteobacteria bacterium]|nr:SH3 domain-containing protein [Deltaproteobacteria bacterium]